MDNFSNNSDILFVNQPKAYTLTDTITVLSRAVEELQNYVIKQEQDDKIKKEQEINTLHYKEQHHKLILNFLYNRYNYSNDQNEKIVLKSLLDAEIRFLCC